MSDIEPFGRCEHGHMVGDGLYCTQCLKQTSGMRFEKALESLREGNVIRRNSKPNNHYFVHERCGLTLKRQFGSSIRESSPTFSWVDIMAEDWEVVK